MNKNEEKKRLWLNECEVYEREEGCYSSLLLFQ